MVHKITLRTSSDLGFVAQRLELLSKISRSLHHLDERQCNENMDESQQKRLESRERNLVMKAKGFAKDLGFDLYRQSDPRGCSIYLCNKGEATPSLYSRGHAVC